VGVPAPLAPRLYSVDCSLEGRTRTYLEPNHGPVVENIILRGVRFLTLSAHIRFGKSGSFFLYHHERSRSSRLCRMVSPIYPQRRVQTFFRLLVPFALHPALLMAPYLLSSFSRVVYEGNQRRPPWSFSFPLFYIGNQPFHGLL